MSMPSAIKWPSFPDAAGKELPDDVSKPSRPVWCTADTASASGPCLRAGHALASFSNRLYLFGGYCDYASYIATGPENADQIMSSVRGGIGLHFNSLYEYSLDTAEWRVLHSGCPSHEARLHSLPKPRRHASLVVHAGSLFIYGGFDVDDAVLPDLWEFRIESRRWFLIQAPSVNPFCHRLHDPSLLVGRGEVPVARAEHTAVVRDHCMIVFGGYDGKKKLSDTYVYHFASKQWSRPIHAELNAPNRRCKHSAVVYKTKMYVVGGFQFKEGENYALTDMHALDLDSFVWSTVLISNSCPEALQGHKAVVCGDSMYILGGKVRTKARASVPSGSNTPATLMNMVPTNVTDNGPDASATFPGLPTQPATVDVPYPNAHHRQPNDTRSSGLNHAVFRYYFDSNKWTVVDTGGQAPAPRQLHAAVAVPTKPTRSSIFLFGGTDRSKQRFFGDLSELRGIHCPIQASTRPCISCAATKSMLGNKLFSDVRFMMEGRSIYAHRCILYARSEYFRNMFDSRMRETSEIDIPITDVSYEVFHAVLEYLYSGEVKITHGRLAVDLLKAADMFQIEGLQNLCVEKVEQAVTIENAAFICQVADTHNARNLKQYCITFIMQNFKEVIKSDSFQCLMRQDPGGLGHEILEAYSDNNPYAQGAKRPRT